MYRSLAQEKTMSILWWLWLCIKIQNKIKILFPTNADAYRWFMQLKGLKQGYTSNEWMAWWWYHNVFNFDAPISQANQCKAEESGASRFKSQPMQRQQYRDRGKTEARHLNVETKPMQRFCCLDTYITAWMNNICAAGRLYFVNVQVEDTVHRDAATAADSAPDNIIYLCIVFNQFLRNTANGDDQRVMSLPRPGEEHSLFQSDRPINVSIVEA